MRIAVIGSRNFNDYELLKKELLKFPAIKEIISGGAKGADSLARQFASEHNIPICEYKPQYKQFGRSAPIVRNKIIAENCDELVAFWDYKSKGTKFTIDQARKLEKKIHIIQF